MADITELHTFFKTFMNNVLINHNIEQTMGCVAEDIIGIGMGEQGFVSSKEDVMRILNGNKAEPGNAVSVRLENLSVRCYEEKYATICGILKIRTAGSAFESTLGQMMNVRRENGRWVIYTLQATPLFNAIEEMEAYPIKFAENVLEKYRQQEQIAKSAQTDSVGIYRINFSEDIFEDAILKNDWLIRTSRGEPYERTMFDGARTRLKEADSFRFIAAFSVGNIFKMYNSGKTEVSMEYETVLPDGSWVWVKTIVKLYMDKCGESLKGYLYVVDIDREKRRELELLSRTELDSMTEIYNRKYSEIRVTEKLAGTAPDVVRVFFMIDLDRFKEVNDNYGHIEGDRAIKEAVECIKSLIRKGDLAGRIGGDEFCMYIQGDLTLKAIEDKAERLCGGIRKITFADGNHLSCSIGIVFCELPDSSFTDIYRKADKALYEQKRKGRDGYTVYSCDV